MFLGINRRSAGLRGRRWRAGELTRQDVPLFRRFFDHMKTIRVPFGFRSFGAALALAGLQFSPAVLPCAYAEDQGQAKAKFFDWAG